MEQSEVEGCYFDALRKSGRNGCGRYQIILATTVNLGTMAGLSIVYGLPLFEKTPYLLCQNPADHNWSRCTTNYICQGEQSPQVLYQIDYSSSESLINWFQQLGLICTSDFNIALLGSSFFLGWTLSCILVPQLADQYGRLRLLKISHVIVVLALALVLISRRLWLTTGALFVLGITASCSQNVSFVYLTECVVPEYRSVAGSSNIMCGFVIPIVLTLWFTFANKNYAWYVVLCMALCALNVLVMQVYLEESGEWLLKNGRLEEASQVVENVYRKNQGVKSYSAANLPLLEFEFMKFQLTQAKRERYKAKLAQERQNLKSQQRPLKAWLQLSSVRLNFCLMICLWMTVTFSYWLLSFQTKYIDGSFWHNTVSGSIADVLASFLGLVVWEKYKLYSFTVCMGAAVLGGLGLFLIQGGLSWLWVLVARLGVASSYNLCFISNSELFPTLFKATSLGLCNFAARFITVLSPYLAELQAPLPIALFIVLNACAVIMSVFLKQLKE